jgi:hypothetical protein
MTAVAAYRTGGGNPIEQAAKRVSIDEYLREKKADFKEMRRKTVEELRKNRPQRYAKLMAAKERRSAKGTEPELTPR